jgi:hypothetical protein
VCLIAVSDHGKVNIKDVPANVIDKEICMLWLKNAENEVYPLERIQDKIKDEDVYLAALELDGDDLKNVPTKYINQKMCDVAVKESFRAFAYVPDKYVTDDMLAFVFKSAAKDPWFLSEITHKRFSKEYWTKSRVEKIIHKAPNATSFLMQFVILDDGR